MRIISSSWTLGRKQRDGTCYVAEVHDGDDGIEYLIEYGPVGELDFKSIMQAHAQQLMDDVTNDLLRVANRDRVALKVNDVLKAAVQTGALDPTDVPDVSATLTQAQPSKV